MVIIQWCNDNNGFLTAILSVIGLLLSIIAIVVSIHTARLPFKKKILLGSSLLLGASVNSEITTKPFIIGLAASATNVGNRMVSLTYLGYAIKREGRLNKIYPINREFQNKAFLESSEMFEVQFQREELKKAFSKVPQKTKLFVYADDTEGTEYKRRVGTVGKLLQNLED